MRISNGAGPPEKAKAERPNLQLVLRHYGSFVEHSGNHLCVVHEESQPSMSVNLDKGLVNCMSCGFAGSSWDIIMKKEDLDFRSAVTFAADAGFENEAPNRSGDDVQSVLGRKRAGVSRNKGNRRAGGWSRPW